MAEQTKKKTPGQEATRIANILGGLKQKTRETVTKQNVSKAAIATGSGLKAAKTKADEHVGAAREFVRKDLEQTKKDMVSAKDKTARASKLLVGAGGAAAGYAARGAVGGARAVDSGLQFATANPWPFFIVAIIVYIYEVSTKFYGYSYMRLLAYVGLGLWAWLIFYRQLDPSLRSIKVPIMVSTAAFISPVFVGWVMSILARFNFIVPAQAELTLDIIVMYVLAPLWIYIILWSSIVRRGKVMQTIAVVLMVVWLLAGVFSLEPAMASMDEYREQIPTDEIIQKTTNFMAEGWKKTIEALKQVPKTLEARTKELYTRWMDEATGGIYSENVNDDNAKIWNIVIVQLQTYNENEEYEPYEEIMLKGRFTETKKEEKHDFTPFDTLYICCGTKEEPTIGTANIPSVEFIDLFGGGGLTVRKCTMPGLAKSGRVELIGSFDFHTKSKHTVELTTSDKKASLVGESKEPQADPTVIGPVLIAIEFEATYPISADPGKITGLIITVKDYDAVYGRIRNLYDFKVEMPDEMKLGECILSQGGKIIDIDSTEDGTINTNQIEYPIENYVTFICDVQFSENSYSMFTAMGEQRDSITEEVYVSTKYKYEIARGIPINIIGGSETLGIGDENLPVTKITATEDEINEYLEKNAGSRLKNQGKNFYDLGIKKGIDPPFAVAVAFHESAKGTSNIAISCNNFFGEKGDGCGKFEKFSTPRESIESFYNNIENNYLPKGQNTPKKMVATKLCNVANKEEYFCCNLEPVHCYCCDGDAANWISSVTSTRAAIGGASLKATDAGNKVLETAKAMEGYRNVAHCWDACTKIYDRAGVTPNKVCSTGEAYNSKEIIKKRCEPQPGDILQIPSRWSPTGEHNIIFDHLVGNTMHVWHASGAGKPIEPETYSPPPKIYIIWEPV